MGARPRPRPQAGFRRVAAAAAPWTLPSLVTVGIVFAIVGRLHDALAEGAFPAGKLLLGLGVLALVTSPTLTVVRRAIGTTQGKALLLFTAAMFLSLPFSLLRSGSLELTIAFVTRTLPFIAIMLVSVRSVGDVERILRTMIVMQICVGLLIAGGFGVVLYGADGPRTTLAGSYDPNDLALLMAVEGAACLWALRDRKVLWKLAGFVGLALGMYVIVRTYSRGGTVSFGLMIALAFFLSRRMLPKWLRFALVPAVLVALSMAPSQYLDRLSTLGQVENDYNLTDPSGRTQVWKRGFGYFLSRPITGVGVGQFPVAEGRYGEAISQTAGWKWSAAHNMYVEAAAEMGIPGLLSVLGMLIPSILLWLRVRTRPPRSESELAYQRVVEAIGLGVVTFMTGTMFLSAALSPMIMLLVALGMATHMLPEAYSLQGRTGGAPAPAPAAARRPPPHRRPPGFPPRAPMPSSMSSSMPSSMPSSAPSPADAPSAAPTDRMPPASGD